MSDLAIFNKSTTDKTITRSTSDILTAIRTNYFTALLGDAKSIQVNTVFEHVKTTVEKGETHGQGGKIWRCINIRPGISPIENLAAALSTPDVLLPKGEVIADFQKTVEQTLRKSSLGLVSLHEEIQEKFQKSFNLLILINNFDDLFEFLPDNKALQVDRISFVNLLLTASVWEKAPIYLAIAITPELISQSFKFGGLGKVIQEKNYFLKELSISDYVDKVNDQFKNQDQTFKDELIKDLQSEQSISHLGFKWKYLMEALSSDNYTSLSEGYSIIGGLHNIVNFKAEKLYNSLTPKEQKLSRNIFQACSQTSKEAVIAKPVTLSHIWKMNEDNHEQLSLEDIIDVIRKYNRILLLEIIEPTQRIQGVSIDIDKTLVTPINSSMLNQWPRAIKWIKEESVAAFNYQNIVQHAIHNQGQVNDNDLLNVMILENAKYLFETEKVNEFWAHQYVDLEIPIGKPSSNEEKDLDKNDTEGIATTDWAKNYKNTLDLAKKYVQKSLQKIENIKLLEKKREERIKKFTRIAAVLGFVLALIAGIFWLKAERVKSNMMQQNFITVLADNHLIEINFKQRTEVLNRKDIRTQKDVIQYFKAEKIIPLYDSKKEAIVENAFYSIFDLNLALSNDYEATNAIVSNAQPLLKLIENEDQKENQYYYYALKAHYDKLTTLKDLKGREVYESDEGFRTIQSNPTKDNQFAFISKFGKIYIAERNIAHQQESTFKKIKSFDLDEDAYALAFSPDGKKLYAGTITGKVYSWEIDDIEANTLYQEILGDFKEKIYHIQAVGEDQLFLTTKYKIIDFKNNRVFDTQKKGGNYKIEEIQSIGISPNPYKNKYLIVGGSEKTLIFNLGNNNRLRLANDPKILEHNNDICTAVAIDDDNQLALGTLIGNIYFINLGSIMDLPKNAHFVEDIKTESINYNKKQITSISFFTKDGKSLLAYSNNYGELTLSKRDEINDEFSDLELKGHKGAVWKIIFNNKNELISMEDNKIYFWKTSVAGLAKSLNQMILN